MCSKGSTSSFINCKYMAVFTTFRNHVNLITPGSIIVSLMLTRTDEIHYYILLVKNFISFLLVLFVNVFP